MRGCDYTQHSASYLAAVDELLMLTTWLHVERWRNWRCTDLVHSSRSTCPASVHVSRCTLIGCSRRACPTNSLSESLSQCPECCCCSRTHSSACVCRAPRLDTYVSRSTRRRPTHSCVGCNIHTAASSQRLPQHHHTYSQHNRVCCEIDALGVCYTDGVSSFFTDKFTSYTILWKGNNNIDL